MKFFQERIFYKRTFLYVYTLYISRGIKKECKNEREICIVISIERVVS
jgi:hypothetical protein